LLALLAFPLVRGYLSQGNAPATTQAEQASPAAIEQVPADPVEQPQVVGAGVDQVMDAAGPQDTAEAADVPVVSDVPAADVAVAGDPMAAGGQDMQAAASTDADIDGADVAATDDTAADTQAPAHYKAVTLEDIPAQIGPVALREAAVEGDPKALFVIGERLMGNGPGTPGSDMKEAVRWYEMAAELGYAPAQYRVGNAYEKGIGAERDLDAAKSWYQLAAEQGNASAMHNLAVLYATEVDGKRDMDTAAHWFLEAAELGVKDSQVNLGILAARGEGVQQDLAESYKWLALAAKAGDADAATKRDEVAKFMRPDQLEQARGAVELWKARPVDVAVNSIELPDAWKTSGEATASAPQAPAVDMKKAIRNIQAILNKSGYDAGTADGVMGAKTRSAISQFQKDNGLLPTGEVDKALVDKLLEINEQS
ncbi:MAG: SEL1-like repeat protein, partial [Oricola sp.]